MARAALREPDSPTARPDGPDRGVRLLVDTREALVGERTRTVNRLDWHLHELDPLGTHQAREQLPPHAQAQPAATYDLGARRLLRTRILGGLISEYRYAA